MNRRCPRCAWIWLALAVGAFSPCASAQEGPIVFGEREQLKKFDLENIHAAVQLEYRRERDSIETTGSPKEEFEDDRYEERFEASATGHIVHPNLVDLRLMGTFGLIQEETHTSTTNDSSDGQIYTWDVAGTILRKEEAPVTLYSRRSRELINRQFGPSLDQTTTTTGGILEWRSKKVPTRLEAYHQEQSVRSLEESGDYDVTQDTFTWHSEGQPSPHQTLSWDYSFNSVEQTTVGTPAAVGPVFPLTTSFQTHSATLGHAVGFGRDYMNSLASSVNYINQTGDFEMERLDWSELLTMRHSPKFETRYRYDFSYQSVTPFSFGIGDATTTEQTRHNGQASFIHRLYSSLVTTGTVGIQQIDFSGESSLLETYASLNFDYRKQVPLGVFTGLLNFGIDRQENDARGAVIVNEQRTFPDIAGDTRITLVGPNIDPNTIVIRDVSGLPLILGRDYQIDTRRQDAVLVDRIIGGDIAPGEAVLITYELVPQSANVSTTNSFAAGARYDIERGLFKGLALYIRYSEQDQSIDADVPSQFIANSFTDVTYGTEYRVGALTLGAEQQFHDSTITPYDTNRFFARYNSRVSAETVLGANAAYTTIEYTDLNNTVEVLTASASISQRLARGLAGNALVLWRDENDDFTGRTTGLEEQLNLTWGYRQTKVYVQFRNTNLESDVQDSSFQILTIGIRREF